MLFNLHKKTKLSFSSVATKVISPFKKAKAAFGWGPCFILWLALWWHLITWPLTPSMLAVTLTSSCKSTTFRWWLQRVKSMLSLKQLMSLLNLSVMASWQRPSCHVQSRGWWVCSSSCSRIYGWSCPIHCSYPNRRKWKQRKMNLRRQKMTWALVFLTKLLFLMTCLLNSWICF